MKIENKKLKIFGERMKNKFNYNQEGEFHGTQFFYSKEEKLIGKSYYNNGILEKSESYYENGTYHSVKNYNKEEELDGTQILYHLNGKLAEKVKYKDGKILEIEKYYENGSKKYEFNKNGIKEYYPHGEMKQIKEIVEKSLRKDFKNIIVIEAKNNTIKSEIRNADLFKKYNDLQTKLVNFEINLVDSTVITKNYIYNKSEEMIYNKTLQVSEKIEEIYKNNEKIKNEEIYKTPQMEKFLNHYVNKEIKGLSIEHDKKKIEELLKIELSEKNIENFIVLKFDKNNKVIEKNDLTKGTIDRSTIYMRELIKDIISTSQIKGVIVVHHHPSGSTKPSSSDINLTKKLKEALNFLDIKLYDHIIISREGKRNLQELGLDEVEKSKPKQQKIKNRRIDFRQEKSEKELER